MLGEEAERISHRWNDGSRKKRSKMTMETTGHPQNPEIILRCIVREIRVLRSLGLGWDLSLAPPSNPSDAVHLQEPEGRPDQNTHHLLCTGLPSQGSLLLSGIQGSEADGGDPAEVSLSVDTPRYPFVQEK
uniref:Uncharacterized protein n=1 Tax=Oryza nivara TaxID=4536 RepID=A0A0E0IFB3_ORYNI